MKNVIVIMVFGIFFSTINLSQAQNGWELGASASLIKFNNKNASYIGDKHIFNTPKLNLTYNFKNNFAIDTEISFNTINNIGIIKNSVKYTSFGGSIRYHFKEKCSSLNPYVFVGGTFVKSERKRTPTLNFGLGNTHWITDKIGVNTQAIYKFSEKRFESMRSHLQFTVGIVYNFSFNSSFLTRKRLWETKH